MTTVLVTGGAGFIGSHLVERLLDGGMVVRVLDNLSTGFMQNLHPERATGANGSPAAIRGRRLELMVGDVRDDRLVRTAVRGVECVFHLAAVPPTALALPYLSEMHGVNVHGTLNVLQAAVAEGVRRVVFASCGSVYGPTGNHAVTEGEAPRPTSLFAASKLAGEIYCRTISHAHGLETVSLRCLGVYGPRQRPVDGLVAPLLT